MVHSSHDRDSAIDATLRALADEHRRLTIRYLMETPEGTASFDGLRDHVTAHSSIDTDSRDVAIRLHHVHLPLLADTDIVEYDPRSKTVRYREDPLVEGMLSSIEEVSDNASDR